MEVIEAIKGRRSIRKYKDEPVARELILQIIEAGRWAPSAMNAQPWKFIVTTDQAKKEKMADRSRYAKFLPNAPVAIIVCARFDERRQVEDKALRYFSIQDTAAAIQNMLLAAYSLGLGTCWIGDFDERQLKELFTIPENYNPVAIIALGYPDVQPTSTFRKPVEEIIDFQ